MNQELVFNLVTAGAVYFFVAFVVYNEDVDIAVDFFTEEDVESYGKHGVLLCEKQIYEMHPGPVGDFRLF